MDVQNGAECHHTYYGNNWCSYVSLPPAVIGSVGTKIINHGSVTATLSVAATCYMIRDPGWWAVDMTGWDLYSTMLMSCDSNINVYFQNFSAGTYTWSTSSAMYACSALPPSLPAPPPLALPPPTPFVQVTTDLDCGGNDQYANGVQNYGSEPSLAACYSRCVEQPAVVGFLYSTPDFASVGGTPNICWCKMAIVPTIAVPGLNCYSFLPSSSAPSARHLLSVSSGLCWTVYNISAGGEPGVDAAVLAAAASCEANASAIVADQAAVNANVTDALAAVQAAALAAQVEQAAAMSNVTDALAAVLGGLSALQESVGTLAARMDAVEANTGLLDGLVSPPMPPPNPPMPPSHDHVHKCGHMAFFVSLFR